MIFSSDSKYPSRSTYGGAILPARHTAKEGPNAQRCPASRAQSSARSNDGHPTNCHIISRRQSHARFTTRVSEHKSGEEVLA
jgi:hypothetical protein